MSYIRDLQLDPSVTCSIPLTELPSKVTELARGISVAMGGLALSAATGTITTCNRSVPCPGILLPLETRKGSLGFRSAL